MQTPLTHVVPLTHCPVVAVQVPLPAAHRGQVTVPTTPHFPAQTAGVEAEAAGARAVWGTGTVHTAAPITPARLITSRRVRPP